MNACKRVEREPSRQGAPETFGCKNRQAIRLKCTGKWDISAPDMDHIRKLSRQMDIDLETRILHTQFNFPRVIDEPAADEQVGR